MEWVTTVTKKGKKRRHMRGVKYERPPGQDYTICEMDLSELDQVKDDPTAPKCKSCLRVLKRLIEG